MEDPDPNTFYVDSKIRVWASSRARRRGKTHDVDPRGSCEAAIVTNPFHIVGTKKYTFQSVRRHAIGAHLLPIPVLFLRSLNSIGQLRCCTPGPPIRSQAQRLEFETLQTQCAYRGAHGYIR